MRSLRLARLACAIARAAEHQTGLMSSETYHEPYAELSDETKDMHRAILSLMEELEAIDWYQQRADVTKDADLRAVLVHNKNEEIEHAMMTLEWIRRKSAVFDANARAYLFTEGPIAGVEESKNGRGHDANAAAKAEVVEPIGAKTSVAARTPGSLGIGSLKK
jgi:ferritin-like protein